MKVRFLADANLDQDIVLGVWRRDPLVDFELPQQFIPDSTPDPSVLRIAAERDAILVTHDVRTMPRHFGEFLQTSTSPGVILIPTKTSISVAIDELLLIWMASEPDDWRNQLRRLPL